MPYIEVHEDGREPLGRVADAAAGPRVALIDGYAAQGYTLAMSLALEHLGRAECENEFSVGT